MKKYCYLLAIMLLQICFAACSDKVADKPDPFDGRTQTPDLIANWTKDNDYESISRYETLNLYADGAGRYTTETGAGTLEWAASNDSITMKFDDGTLVNTYYNIRGCGLGIDNVGQYKTEMPITGQWFAYDLEGEKQALRYSYSFNKNGSVMLEYFDSNGVWHKNGDYYWWRTGENTIKVYGDSKTSEWGFTEKDGVLTLSDGGVFVREDKWKLHGTWTSVYTESGGVKEGQYPYSTIEIQPIDSDYDYMHSGYDRFYIEGVNENGYKFNAEFYCKYSTTNDIILYSDDTDAKIITFRLKYDREKRVCYMEVCNDRDFSHYVGYAKNKD